MNTKKIVMILLVTLCAFALCLGVSACAEENAGGDTAQVPASQNDSATDSRSQSEAHVHDYLFDGFVWTGHTAQAKYVCAEDNDAVFYDATVTDEITVGATCENAGLRTYTATYDGHTDTKTETLDATGHKFTDYISDDNATYDSDGTKTARCDHGCGATDTIVDEGTKLKGCITFKTLTVNGTLLYCKVPNTQETYSFLTEVTVNGNARYTVSTDLAGINVIPSKTVALGVGDNKYYVVEYVDGEAERLFEVNIRRKPVYTVSFNADGGSKADDQYVEEDAYAVAPETEKAGYTLIKWDFDFASPITEDKTIKAVWQANTDTPYKVEYYLQNLEDDDYTLTKTENLTGTTDTTATAEIKIFEHFTHVQISESVEYGNIDSDGQTVLKVYYTRDKYNVVISATENVTLDKSYNGQYKYGYIIEDITATFNNYIGYEWDGFYVDAELISTDKIIVAYTVDKAVNVVAKAKVKAEYEPFTFASTQATCAIMGVKEKTVTELVIPNEVTNISLGALNGCSSLHSLMIPFVGNRADVTSTDTYQYPFGYIFGETSYTGSTAITQFYYSSSTSSMTSTTYYIPTSLKSVTVTGSNILYGAFYNYVGLTNMTIGNSVKSIGSKAFYNCRGLTSVTIGNGVTSIGDYAFFNCSGLTSVIIPDSVASIGEYAFYGCSGLISITIPDSVASIGEYAFYNCYKLVEVYNKSSIDITAGSSNNGYVGYYAKAVYTQPYTSKLSTDENGYIVYTDGADKILVGYTGNETVLSLPSDITEINQYAFYNCSKLTSVTIPDSVKSIGNNAFCNCRGLTSVTIPDSVTSIGNNAFYGCYKLVEVYNKSNLSITKGSTDNGYVGYYAKAVYTQPYTSKLSTDENGYIIYADGNDKILIGYSGNMTDLTLPSGITEINQGAFYNCSSLTSITIPDSVTSIGNNAFCNCIGLTSITIPDGVTSIGDYAFCNCIGLTSITIPDGVTSIGDYAFYNCSGLTSVIIPDSVASIGEYAFCNCSGLTSVTIPDGVTSIGDYAFYNCSGLTSVTIGNGVTRIDRYAFLNCSKLTSVTFKNTSGWYVSTSSSATSGTNVTVTDPAQNATYLTSTYYNRYWKRKTT